MREAAASASPAVRSIAQISWRVDMVPGTSLVSPVNLTDSGKVRVNREGACSGKRPRKSSVDGDRSATLTGRFTRPQRLDVRRLRRSQPRCRHAPHS
jgi:hypothetical protein